MDTFIIDNIKQKHIEIYTDEDGEQYLHYTGIVTDANGVKAVFDMPKISLDWDVIEIERDEDIHNGFCNFRQKCYVGKNNAYFTLTTPRKLIEEERLDKLLEEMQ